jgi:hypothetical protein
MEGRRKGNRNLAHLLAAQKVFQTQKTVKELFPPAAIM